jgi:hypothetical protein
MNYISKLQHDGDALRCTIADTAAELGELLSYLGSDKFNGPDCDHVHIRTDLMPKLLRLRMTLLSD